MNLDIVISKDLNIRADAYKVRVAVFVDEQGFRDVPDEIDNYAYHIAAYDGDMVVGCGRFFPEKLTEYYHIGRIAVLSEYRGKKIGTAIMFKIEDFLKELGAKGTVLSAQRRARAFYEELGYIAVGEEYLEENYPHIHMRKSF